MSERRVDVAILGAGTAGLTARRAAKREGKSVVMIDPGPFGTTCARVGCMPSKLLIAAADAAHHARHASQFGVHTEAVAVDGPAVMRRIQRERDRFVGFVVETIDEARDAGELLVGRGQLASPNTVVVTESSGETARVAFETLVVATGSTPFIPPPFREFSDLIMTNEDVFELSDLPESVLVVGLGVIGLELGQAFHRLGVRTTLVGVGGKVGPISDPRILDVAKRVFSSELDLHPSYELTELARAADGVRVSFVDSTGTARTETFQRLLVAAGRRPNLERLGLEKLALTAKTIDRATLQLGDAGVFVAGDVNSFHPLLHEAADDGRLAGQNAARFPQVVAPARRASLAIAFSDPQIGIVGRRYAELQACEAVAGEVDYKDQGRARVQGINQGRVRIYADKDTGQLLGAELFGPRVEHLSHLLAWAIQSRLTVEEALEMPFYHPVVEEGIRTALRDLSANLRRGAPIKCRVSELGVGS